jgi:organic hydroperoxide reductase OsmC/OhrA
MSRRIGSRQSYAARITWTGNDGEGTAAYSSYRRQYRIAVEGKPELVGSADAAFRGNAELHNPEDLFLAALSACHMLFFLSLCARSGVRVTAYEDEAVGRLVLHPAGGGRFEQITLRPVVTIATDDAIARARQLHETAHKLCFIANSCSAPIRVEPVIRSRDGGESADATPRDELPCST